MKKAYLTLGFLLGLLTASVIFAFLDSERSDMDAGVRRMKVAHGLPTNHPIHAGITHFAERVAYYSAGSLQFDVFPNTQLGSGTQTLEQMQAGTLDAAQVGAASLGSFIPQAKVFSLPYLFRSSEHYWAVLNGEVGQELLDVLAVNASGKSSGFRGLTFYDAGSRNFYGKTAIQQPSDLKGMKVRVMNDPVAIDMMKALGASPTPISWGELYTSLQQGVVDGAENNPPSFVSSRHFEVCKEFSFDHHSRIPDILFVSEKTWQSLSKEEQGWVKQAAMDSTEFQRKVWDESIAEALDFMREEGVQVHEVSIPDFMAATDSVREKYAVGELKGLVERIQEVSE